MNLAVFAGGISGERAVSLDSGRQVAAALLSRGHRVLLCDPVLPLRFSVGAPLFASHLPPPMPAPTALPHRFCLGDGVIEALAHADCVFLALHGGAGEDGTLQAALDVLGVPYTGSGPQACLLAQNKSLAKALFVKSGVEVPPTRTPDSVTFPCIVKERDGGSSVGLSLCRDRASLLRAMARAGDTPLLIEDYIAGAEYSVGILDAHALPPVEIRVRGTLHDYESKYQCADTEELCPAPSLDEAARAQLCALALRAHRALGLGAYSRIDFLRARDGRFVCLEANALPGMTARSLLPCAAAAAGLSFADLCERIVEGALRERGRGA